MAASTDLGESSHGSFFLSLVFLLLIFFLHFQSCQQPFFLAAQNWLDKCSCWPEHKLHRCTSNSVFEYYKKEALCLRNVLLTSIYNSATSPRTRSWSPRTQEARQKISGRPLNIFSHSCRGSCYLLPSLCSLVLDHGLIGFGSPYTINTPTLSCLSASGKAPR